MKRRKLRMSLAERLACAILLFHSKGAWVDEKAAEWLDLTGTPEATNTVLIDMARQFLASERRKRERTLSAPSGDRAAAQPDVPAMRPGEA